MARCPMVMNLAPVGDLTSEYPVIMIAIVKVKDPVWRQVEINVTELLRRELHAQQQQTNESR